MACLPIVAASWMTDIPAAKKIVAAASAKPLDEWSKAAAKTAADRLAGIAEKPVAEYVTVPPPAHLDDVAKKQFIAGQEVYHREGSCMTCHRGDGNGLAPAFPPISNSPFLTDTERAIKIVLFGLMGPIEVKGQKFDGQVPMTPFGGMLKDEEIANVLTYVRNTFGNKAGAVSAAEVKKVREANPNRMMIMTVDELLKAHPLK